MEEIIENILTGLIYFCLNFIYHSLSLLCVMDKYCNINLYNCIHVNFFIYFIHSINTFKITNYKTVSNFLHFSMREDIFMTDYVSVPLFWPPERAILFLGQKVNFDCIFAAYWQNLTNILLAVICHSNPVIDM